MQMPRDLAVDASGRHVYVTSNAPGGVAVLQRTAIGNLSQPATGARYSRLTNDGAGGVCAAGHLLEGVHTLAISPDGRNVYAWEATARRGR
jgi:hypothetical protein